MLKIRFSRIRVLSIAAIFMIVMSNWANAVGPVSNWDSASGLKPDEISEPYEIFNNSGVQPTLDAGKVTISTTADSQNAGYIQRESLVDPSGKFTATVN